MKGDARSINSSLRGLDGAGWNFPELRLVEAVLAQAVLDCMSPSIRLRRKARQWVYEPGANPFSFEWCCVVNGFDPDNARQRVMKLKPRVPGDGLPDGLSVFQICIRPGCLKFRMNRPGIKTSLCEEHYSKVKRRNRKKKDAQRTDK